VTTDAKAEYERIRTTYAPARPRDLVIIALVIGLLCVASILSPYRLAFIFGGIAAFAVWEFTKFRLRRNARDFAESPR
jgi:predicted PurR-regulated permease PerM